MENQEIIDKIGKEIMRWKPYSSPKGRQWGISKHEVISGWDPLKNMSDTEMVIKRMAEINSLNNLHLIRATYNRCYAAFGSGRLDELEGAEADGENCMAEAICLAALKLFGE